MRQRIENYLAFIYNANEISLELRHDETNLTVNLSNLGPKREPEYDAKVQELKAMGFDEVSSVTCLRNV